MDIQLSSTDETSIRAVEQIMGILERAQQVRHELPYGIIMSVVSNLSMTFENPDEWYNMLVQGGQLWRDNLTAVLMEQKNSSTIN